MRGNKKFWKKIALLGIGGMFMANSVSGAYPVRTPEGNMPLVHWAVLEAAPGKMQEMIAIGANTVGKETPKETGTYALYGGIDATNHDLMRLLEIYESVEAYRIHGTSLAFQEYRAQRFPILKKLTILEANGIALEQKASGTATVVRMQRHEVKPELLAEYQRLAAAEATRAVSHDEGVLGMFVTAEQANPNIIHTLELYRDKTAYESYAASREAQNFRQKTQAAFLSAHTVENLATAIPLSDKGLHIASDSDK